MVGELINAPRLTHRDETMTQLEARITYIEQLIAQNILSYNPDHPDHEQLRKVTNQYLQDLATLVFGDSINER